MAIGKSSDKVIQNLVRVNRTFAVSRAVDIRRTLSFSRKSAIDSVFRVTGSLL
jgi:hypothetical protein